MSLIPDSELRDQKSLNMAPMVDLLFLLLAIVVVGFITRAAVFDTEFNLVKGKKNERPALTAQTALKGIILKIFENGSFSLSYEGEETVLNSSEEISQAIASLQEAQKINKTTHPILLKIEKSTRWEPIAEVILKIKQQGFEVRPLYEQEKVSN